MTQRFKIALKNPRNPKWRHEPQAQILDIFDEIIASKSRAVHYVNYVGGRGCGKTSIALRVILDVALRYPGERTAWTTRSEPEIDDVIIVELEENLEPEVYRVRGSRGSRYIEWCNGHRTYLKSRNVDNPNKRGGLGLTVMGIVHDEAATGFRIEKLTDFNNGIRGKGRPFFFCLTTSTPLPNGYQSYCQQDIARTVHASSYDSPFLDKENLDTLAAMMDADTVKQELGGQFVMGSGRMWDTFVEKPWPEGNIAEGFQYDPEKPFYLGGDLGGGMSAFQIVQYFDPRHPETGRMMFDGKLAVVVAELVPHQMGMEAVAAEIIEHYCEGDHLRRKPVKVIVGHDVNSSTVVGPSGAEYFRHLGWDYTWPRGTKFRKDVQRQVARSLILNTRGERRFAIAANKNKAGTYEITKQHFGEGKTTGILQVMRNDQYPAPESNEIFNKDKSKLGKNALEDPRDAMLYWMVENHPPSFDIKTVLGK